MSAPSPKYAFKIVHTRPGVAPYRIKVRVPDCHPENKHHAKGVCEECHNNRRRTSLTGPALRHARCRHCQKRFWRADEEGSSPYCSLRCQMVHETMAPGDGWRAHWPGARFQRLAEVPAACPRPRCGGVLQETETGVICSTCGTESHVAECLARAVLLGRDSAASLRSVEAL